MQFLYLKPLPNQLFQGVSAPSSFVPQTATTGAVSKMSAVSSALLVATRAEVEESAQSILERHVSRVFDSPDAGPTPTSADHCHLLFDAAAPSSRTAPNHDSSGNKILSHRGVFSSYGRSKMGADGGAKRFDYSNAGAGCVSAECADILPTSQKRDTTADLASSSLHHQPACNSCAKDK